MDLSEIDIGTTRGVKFLSVARWRGGAEWHPHPHAHPFCELIVVAQGSERAVVAGKEVICEAGNALFYPATRRHEEWQEGSSLLEFFCIEFTWPKCPDLMPYLIQDRQGRLLELAQWLDAESLARYAGDGAYRDLVMRMMVGEMLRLVVSPPQKVVEQIQDFVHHHLPEPLSLDDLARECGLNKYYLVRTFRTLTGITPMEYVRQVRVDTARQLVLATTLPLNEIAPRVGIANEFHLSRLLKQRFGRGARDLRRQARRSAIKTAESAEADDAAAGKL